MNSESESQTVTCPHCDARYLLPAHLVGPGGARVNCPNCHTAFVVPATGAAATGAVGATQAPTPAPNPSAHAPAHPSPAPHGDASPASHAKSATPTPAETADSIALEIVEALAAKHGEAILRASAAGRLFEDCGTDVLDAWDDFRRRTHSRFGAAPFRAALLLRLGVDLPESAER